MGLRRPPLGPASLFLAQGLNLGLLPPIEQCAEWDIGGKRHFSVLGVGTLRRTLAWAEPVSENRSDYPRRQAAVDFTPDVLEGSSDAFLAITSDGEVLAWNRSAVETFGYGKDEAIGHKLVDLIVPERSREDHLAALLRAASSDKQGLLAKHREMTTARKDGSEFPLEFTISAIELDGRRTFGIFARDITERRRAEREQQKLATIVETASDAIVSGTPGGRILTWNAAAERLYGYSAEEMIGQPLGDILPLDSQEFVAEVRDRVMAEKPVTEVETKVRHKDGHLIDVSVSVGS